MRKEPRRVTGTVKKAPKLKVFAEGSREVKAAKLPIPEGPKK
jgi:hypothetical protein